MGKPKLSFPYRENAVRRLARQMLGGFVLVWIIGQYKLSQIKLARRPNPVITFQYSPGLSFIDLVLGLGRNTRVLGEENIPAHGPAIFAANHVKLDDPFVIGNAVHWLSDKRIRVRVMMRNDFFGKLPGWVKKIFDPDEVASIVGAILVQRQNVALERLRPFIDVLLQNETFVIFPGRSRTRSGLIFDYREWIRSPGATSYFVCETQQERPDVGIPVYPVMRTINPVTGRGAINFGRPLCMASTEDHELRRQLDYQLTVAIANLIEINVPHVVSLILYLRCLHNLGSTLDIASLAATAQEILAGATHPYIDPAARDNLDAEIRKTLAYFKKSKLLELNANQISLNTEAILAAPEVKDSYRHINPVKFLVNHVMHVPSLIKAAERAVL